MISLLNHAATIATARELCSSEFQWEIITLTETLIWNPPSKIQVPYQARLY
ncbi:MAG: hypothetical protein HFE90_05475 [Firmicutes bacterium]|nr:hypothetical protein [Bacillota bacterium]